VFKHYPLGTACNAGLSRDIHPHSCEAAVGTQCARRQGKFWEFHDHTFDNQGNLGTKTMLQVADQLGLDRAEFEECLNRDTLWDEVRAQVAQGKELGITGTPTMYVNGKELSSPHPLIVEAALREELKARGVTELPEDADDIFP
jgi:protein-disulfide isomerase